MQPILEKELPIKEGKNRKLLWLFALGFLLVGLSYFTLNNGNKVTKAKTSTPFVENKVEPPVQNTDLINPQNTLAVPSSKENAIAQNEAPSAQSTVATHKKAAPIKSESNSTVNAKKSSQNESSSLRVEEKQLYTNHSLNSNSSNPITVTTTEKISSNPIAENVILESLDLLNNLQPQQLEPTSNLKLNFTPANHTPSIITPNSKSQFSYSVGLRIGYVNELSSIHLGLANDFLWTKNKLSYGLQIGADYIPANYYSSGDIFTQGSTVGVPISNTGQENIGIDDMLEDSDARKSFSQAFNSDFNSYDHNISIYTGGVVAYNFIDKLTAKTSLGVELFPFSKSPIGGFDSPFPAGTAITSAIEKKYFKYLELTIAYQPTNKVGISLGYHFTDNIASIENETFNTGRLYSGLSYTF